MRRVFLRKSIVLAIGCLYFLLNSFFAYSEDKKIYIHEFRDYSSCVISSPSLRDVQKVLEGIDIEVLSTEKGFDGLIYSVISGNCSGKFSNIYIFSIPSTDYEKSRNLGFRSCESLQEKGGKCVLSLPTENSRQNRNKSYVLIYKNAANIQCESNSGISLQAMGKELHDNEIYVYLGYEGKNGLIHILSCGEQTEHINVYLIPKATLAESKALGYRECAWLVGEGGSCKPH